MNRKEVDEVVDNLRNVCPEDIKWRNPRINLDKYSDEWRLEWPNLGKTLMIFIDAESGTMDYRKDDPDSTTVGYLDDYEEDFPELWEWVTE